MIRVEVINPNKNKGLWRLIDKNRPPRILFYCDSCIDRGDYYEFVFGRNNYKWSHIIEKKVVEIIVWEVNYKLIKHIAQCK